MSSLVATLAGPLSMCTAFVNGIAATNVRAAMPCTHQVRKCASAAVCPSIPIARSPWPASQPIGAHFSNDGSVSAIRSASSRKPVTPRNRSEPTNARSPTS